MRFLALIAILSVIALNSCNHTEEPKEIAVVLQCVDLGARDIALRVAHSAAPEDGVLVLYRNDEPISVIRPPVRDTILYCDSLSPNTNYRFQVKPLNPSISHSEPLLVHTLDTTSHQVRWETDTLYNGGYNDLFDVAIINDTNVIVVGELDGNRDTLGAFSRPYGVAVWNGKSWQYKRVFHHSQFNYIDSTMSYQGISVLGENDVWLSDGFNVFHWDPRSSWLTPYWVSTSVYPSNGQGIRNCWKLPSGKIVGIGRKGSLGYFDGKEWRKIDPGTTTDLSDLWGAIDPASGEYTLLASVTNRYHDGDTKIISVLSDLTIRDWEWRTAENIQSVWFKTRYRIFTAGRYVNIVRGMRAAEATEITDYTEAIRGTDNNDVFVVGHFGRCSHFNGSTWYSYPELRMSSGVIWRLDVSKRLIVAVGTSGPRAIVIRGYR